MKKMLNMKQVLTLFSALAIGAVIVKKVSGRKHIRSREDDPTIPIPSASF